MKAAVLFGLVVSGCATIGRYDGNLPKPDDNVVHAYHAVRSLGATRTYAGGIVFCATRNGLEAMRGEGRASDQWSASIDDSVVQEHVRGALRSDPALRHEPLTAKIVRGEAYLYGTLSSEKYATLAIYYALDVVGVGVVHAAFLTPESPTPMNVTEVATCD